MIFGVLGIAAAIGAAVLLHKKLTVHKNTTPKNVTPDVSSETIRTSSGFTIGRSSGVDPNSYTAWLDENHPNFNIERACREFKKNTGVELHVLDTHNLSPVFDANCIQLESAFKRGVMPPDLKHVIIGHGYGSSVNGTWHSGNHNIFDYIDNHIPAGAKVIVTSCETATRVPGRSGIGDAVIGTLMDRSRPAKICERGRHEIIGDLWFPKWCDGRPVIDMYDKRSHFLINGQRV